MSSAVSLLVVRPLLATGSCCSASFILAPVVAFLLTIPSLGRTEELPIQPAPLDRVEPVDFASEILPLLKRNCLACHHSKEAEGGLVLESYADLIKGGDAGPGVVPSDVEASYVFARASGREEPLMPPEGNSVGAKTLTPEELALLQLWIQQGAPGGEAGSGEMIQWQPLPEPLQPVYALASSPDGRFVASGKANQVIIYDAATMQRVAVLADPELSTAQHPVAGRDIVQSIAFSPNNQTIATGGFRTVRLWRRADAHLSTRGTPYENAVGPVAANPDGSPIALVNAIGDIEIWDADGSAPLHTLHGHSATIRDLQWSGGADRLFSVDEAGQLMVWQPSSGMRQAIAATSHTPRELTAAGDGARVAMVDAHGTVHVWSVAEATKGDSSGDSLQLQPRPTEPPNAATKILQETKDATCIAFAPGSSTQLAIGTGTGQVHVVDLEAGTLLRTIDVGAPVRAIALSEDGSQLVTSSADGTNRLWDFAGGQAIAELGGDPSIEQKLRIARRDSDRQAAQVKRLTDRKTELEERAKSEAEAFAKVKEARDKAAEALAGEVKKVEQAKATVAKTEAAIKETEQATASAQQELETAKQELVKAEETAKAAAEKAQTEVEGVAEEKSEAAAESQPAEASVSKNAGDAAVKEAEVSAEKVEAVKKRVEAAAQKLDELAATLKTQKAELEKQTKAVNDADATRAQKEQELADRQQAFDTSKQASDRAAAAVPAQQQRINQEQRRHEALQRRVKEVESLLASTRKPFVAATFMGEAGESIAMALADGTVRLVRGTDGTAIEQFQIDGLTPSGLLRIANDRLLIHGLDGPAQLRSITPRWELQRMVGDVSDAAISDRVTALDFHPDGHALAVGSGPPSRFGEVKIFAAHNGQLLREWNELHSDTVFDVAFSPDGRLLASAAADKTARLIEIASGSELQSFEGHTHHVLGLAWQDDGQTLATSSADQTVKVWNVETGEQKRTINGFAKEITAITFVGQSPQIATACADGHVRLHDVSNGKAIRSFNASGDFLFTAAVAEDASSLVAAGQSGVVRSWNVSDGKLKHETQ